MHVPGARPPLQLGDHRQHRRDANAARQQQMEARLASGQWEAVVRRRHREDAADRDLLVHRARSSAARRLVEHGDDVAMPLLRIVAQRILAASVVVDTHVEMGAGRERRQLEASRVDELEGGDVLCLARDLAHAQRLRGLRLIGGGLDRHICRHRLPSWPAQYWRRLPSVQTIFFNRFNSRIPISRRAISRGLRFP
jgi:hypothetical protein